MNRFFYGRLAFSNLKKNSGLYLPYILAAIGVSAVYYIMGAISRDEGIKKMPGSGDVAMMGYCNFCRDLFVLYQQFSDEAPQERIWPV